MPLRIALRPRAEADLDAIWNYTVAEWGRGQAVAYLEALNAVFGTLAEFPDMARLRTDITPPVRLHPHRAHLVIYRADAETLDVIRVLAARSDWMAVLTR